MSLRTTLLGLAFAVSCAAAPAPLQEGEARYRKMETAVASAKKLHVEFVSETGNAKVTGTLKIDEGNKLELKVEGKAGVKEYKLTMTCDGEKMNLTRWENPPPPVPLEPQVELPAPPQLAANTAVAFARGGAWLAQEYADGEYRAQAIPFYMERQRSGEEGRNPKPVTVPPREVGALYELANFKEMGATTAAYDLVRKTEKPILATSFTVTIDAATGLPSKREGSFSVPGAKTPLSKWSETYTFKN